MNYVGAIKIFVGRPRFYAFIDKTVQFGNLKVDGIFFTFLVLFCGVERLNSKREQNINTMLLFLDSAPCFQKQIKIREMDGER